MVVVVVCCYLPSVGGFLSVGVGGRTVVEGVGVRGWRGGGPLSAATPVWCGEARVAWVVGVTWLEVWACWREWA